MAFNGLLGLGGMNNQYLGLLGDTLSGVGVGLLNQRPGEGALSGVGQGLQYANQLGQQRKGNLRADEMQKIAQQQLAIQQQTAAQQQAAFQQQQQQVAAQKAAAQSLFGGQTPAISQQAPGGVPRPGQPGGMQPPSPAMAGLDPAQLQILQQMTQGGDPGGAMSIAAQQAFQKPTSPQSSLAKLASNLKAGLISQPEYDAAVRKETYIAPRDPDRSYKDITDAQGNVIGQVDDRGKKDYFSNGITVGPDGSVQIGGPMKAPNATQSQAAGRGSLLATGIAAIKDVDFSKVSPEKVAAVGAAKSLLPNAAGNYVQAKAFNADEQKLLAGQGAITEAVTAAITGAAYAPAQLTNYQNIFVPAAGEEPAVTVGKLQRGAIFLKQLDEMAAGSRLPVDQLPPEMIRAAVDKATAETPQQPDQPAVPTAIPQSNAAPDKEALKKKYGLK